jgi:hypothetical protein
MELCDIITNKELMEWWLSKISTILRSDIERTEKSVGRRRKINLFTCINVARAKRLRNEQGKND